MEYFQQEMVDLYQISMHAVFSVGILLLSFITLKGNIFISW